MTMMMTKVVVMITIMMVVTVMIVVMMIIDNRDDDDGDGDGGRALIRNRKILESVHLYTYLLNVAQCVGVSRDIEQLTYPHIILPSHDHEQ